jgi:cytochrome c oxidase subunit II
MSTVSRRVARLAISAGVLSVLGLAVAGCDARSTPGTMFLAASPESAEIRGLALLLGSIAIFVVLAVNFTIVLSVLRGRRRPESEVRQTHGNTTLEIAWTTITAVVFMAIFVVTVKVLVDVTASPAAAVAQTSFPGDTVTLRATGWRWWWAFEYPQVGVVTANEVYVPTGKPVLVEIMSGDVIHSFWVPRLAGKMDMIPGRTNYDKFVATAPGTFLGLCAEFCGAEHARMQFRIVAVPVPEFSAWAKAQAAPAAEPTTAPEQAGRAAFQTNCAQCHTIRGTQAQGKIGPDLTHFGSRTTIAAGTLPSTPENIAHWIANAQQVKPASLMPNLNIGPVVEPLTAYLTSLK